MYANGKLISHTKLVCENVVFSEPCYLENKCGVRKVFSSFAKQLGNFGYLKIGLMPPKIGSGSSKL
jgi:hypothetical protein